MSDNMTVELSSVDAEDLASRALIASGASQDVARLLARIHVAAESDGIASHGLAVVRALCANLASGRINGRAVPHVTRPRAGLIVADAGGGFPQPAFKAGFGDSVEAARSHGVAMLLVRNAWAADVMGWHVERFAEEGLLALGFANVPASISPTGGNKPVFGTNPICCSIPQSGEPPIIIDQASSVIAKSEIVKKAAAGERLPEGWGLDSDGAPTQDPDAVLAGGSLLPAGGYKGVGVAFIVELFTAILSGSDLSAEAPPLADRSARPGCLSQTFIVVDPAATGGASWMDRVAGLTGLIEAQPGARVPGARRHAARARMRTNGIAIPVSLHGDLKKLAGDL